MPDDDDIEDASDLAISPDDDEDIAFQQAARRIAREAQSMSFNPKGIRDVTKEFAAAAKQLPAGTLVKDDYFTLFEAVGAIEIMDPKMDSGCVPPGDSFEADVDICTPLEAQEIIWIMDQLLCMEIAWHDGYPLSQTVFTSLHIDRLLSPDNRWPYTFDYGNDPPRDHVQGCLLHDVLRGFCIGLIKSCQLVLQIIQSQHFYEEEDFVTHTFGRDLLPRLGNDEACRILDRSLEWLANVYLPDDIRHALEQRLLFRRTYLATLEDDAEHWAYLSPILDAINQTHYLGQAVPEAFSDKVQRQLATSTPPRPMRQIDWHDAYKKWKKLCDDIVVAGELTSFWVCQSPHCLQRATWAFAYREPQPNTFARAYMQNILLGSEKSAENVSQFDLLLTDIRDLVLAGDEWADPESFQIEVTSDPRHLCSRQIEAFMDKAFDEYLNLYRAVCQNRCRIRRLLTQAVPIFDALQGEAYQTDEQLYKLKPAKSTESIARLNPLSTWTKSHKLRIMAWTIQLGLETDIYLPEELPSMYWLLSVMAQKQCALLEHIERFLIDRMKSLTQSRNTRYTAECLVSQDWLRSLHTGASVTRCLSQALHLLCAVLVTTGVIQTPKRDYAQAQLLYDARMKPYLGVVRDVIPSLAEFQQAQQNIGSVDEVCEAMDTHIKAAKSSLAALKKVTPQHGKYIGTEKQWAQEIKQLETTCVAVVVQKSQLERMVGKYGQGEMLEQAVEASIPSPGKRYHDWWAVPQIKERKKV